jgi:hypothetical protein
MHPALKVPLEERFQIFTEHALSRGEAQFV